MTLMSSEVFPTSQVCNTIVLAARKLETLLTAKFETFGFIYSVLRMFYYLKPTYLESENTKLSYLSKKFFTSLIYQYFAK